MFSLYRFPHLMSVVPGALLAEGSMAFASPGLRQDTQAGEATKAEGRWVIRRPMAARCGSGVAGRNRANCALDPIAAGSYDRAPSRVPHQPKAMKETIDFTLNGRPTRLDIDGGRTLLWVLRTELGLTGTKFGCGEGLCGACTVIVDGQAVRSCGLSMKEIAGKEIVTIEGLAPDGKLHPLQERFMEHDALQCGFCTPGMILSAYALLRKNPHPTRDEILRGMNGNLCRCGAHKRIVEAIQSAS